MIIRTIYIDDDIRELRKYKMKFEDDDRSKSRFELTTLNTPKSTKGYEEIEKGRPELILVDFDLTKPDANEDVIGISGVTLSTELRQKFPEIPIVLFTRKSVFKVQDYSNIKQTLSSIDEIIYKNDLFKPDKPLLDFLYELSIGFKKLRTSKFKTWEDLLKLIKAPEDDYDNLKLSNPPIASERKPIWSVSKAVKWIREILIAYPGVLYDAVHSANFLGISKNAFLIEDAKKLFSKAKYSGIFKPTEGRWWKSKLQEIAESIMNTKERDLLTYDGFFLAWERTNKIKIERSKCIFSGESPAERVCHILKKPVKIKYSLSYKPDSRPSVMDEARVSFEAIRVSNKVNDELFDPLGRGMLKDIRKMQKRGG